MRTKINTNTHQMKASYALDKGPSEILQQWEKSDRWEEAFQQAT